MSSMGQAVLKQLQLAEAQPVCVLSGSITKIGLVQEGLTASLKAVAPGLSITVPDKAPVYGALRMAMKS
jgi:hypothetical protein